MVPSLAQNNIDLNSALNGTGFAPVATYSIKQFVYVALEMMFLAAGVGFFFFLLWGGLQWILSGGDKDNTEKARKKVTSALIGLVVILSAYAIATILDIIFFGGKGGIFILQIPSI